MSRARLFVKLPEPSVWEDICRKEEKSSPFAPKEAPQIIDFDAAKTSPVFYGKLFGQVDHIDADPFDAFDPAKGHPAALGYSFVDDDRLQQRLANVNNVDNDDNQDEGQVQEEETPIINLDAFSLPAKGFMRDLIFPVLLPALREMIFQAKREKCFERKRTKFNACDFLTEWLYNHNPKHPERLESPQTISEIPFCKEFSADHPREALPLSLLLSDEQAATIIQSHWRGFCVRREPEVAGLRSWQREWNEMNLDVRNKMSKFWHNQGLYDGRSSTSMESGEGEEKFESVLSVIH